MDLNRNLTLQLYCHVFWSFLYIWGYQNKKKQKRKCPLRVPLRLKGEEGVAGLNAKFNTHPLLWFLRVSRLKWRTWTLHGLLIYYRRPTGGRETNSLYSLHQDPWGWPANTCNKWSRKWVTALQHANEQICAREREREAKSSTSLKFKRNARPRSTFIFALDAEFDFSIVGRNYQIEIWQNCSRRKKSVGESARGESRAAACGV